MKPKRYYFRNTPIFSSPLHYGAPVFMGFTFLLSGLTAEAGDILRGGGGANKNPARAGANNGGAPTPSATDAARANAKDTLARTTRTLDAMRAMQNAARNSAIKGGKNNLGKNPNNPSLTLPNVPNGLGVGGLHRTSDPLQWTGANVPKQTVKNGKTEVTIKQTTQQALLGWQTFNVGKKTTVTFDQKAGGADAGKWIAFNQIKDPTGNPTQILGNIKATGQVYLINQNGIIFGGSSQVNARGLTVSSLPINTNLIDRGLLNNPDAQFLFSGLKIPAGTNGTPEFTPDAPLAANGKYGDVVVHEGAVIKSPSSAAKVGGRITLVGPNVTNNGTILTTDGQTILAAGLQVGFNAHSGNDPSLRGLDPYIGAVMDPLAGLYAGTATHGGIIEAARGSITVAGRQIQQSGALVSTTSVSFNGRIDLLAHYDAVTNPNYDASGTANASIPFISRNSGSVILGEGSLIRLLPEYDSDETAIGKELALRSQINLAGKVIHLGKNSVLLAPNAQVNINAGEWILSGGSNVVSRFTQSVGQVYLDENALIDVSGSLEVSAPVSQNIISVDLRGAELANSPLQRSGKLRNVTVRVDIRDAGIYQGDEWVGTPLADIAGFANLIQRDVGQLTVAGGTVNISAGNSLVMREGSKIDVSGGATHFQAGTVNTTRLITGGRLVDIRDARPDVVYDGIYDGTFTETNAKFGVANVYYASLAPDGGRFDPGSTEGADGGKLSILSPSMALDGKLVGKTFASEKQRQAPPASSSLNLSFLARDKNYASLPVYSPTAPRITFRPDASPAAVADFALDLNGDPLPLAADRLGEVHLSSNILTDGGFGELTVNNPDGAIVVPENVEVAASTGGSITLTASTITLDGSIIARGGNLAFNSSNIDLNTFNSVGNTSGAMLPVAAADRGIFTLGSKGVVSAAGLLVDDRANVAAAGTLPLFLDGGSIEVKSHSALLAVGGKIDVSGGARVNPTGGVNYGKGGSLTISAGRDLGLPAVLGGRLVLGATLSGFSGGEAGSLSIQAPAIQIGGASAIPGVNVLGSDFFNQGGFGTFSLTGSGLASGTPGEFVTGLFIAPEARIRPVVAGWVVDTTGGGLKLRTILRDEGVRIPASISFNALGSVDSLASVIQGRGDVVLSEGAVIHTDAKGSVSFSGETVMLSGSVITPGGAIAVNGAARYPSTDPNLLLPTALIGKTAFLSAAGKTVLIDNVFGLRQGEVVAGGSISITGNIAAEHGAVLDVSGTNGVLDLPPSASKLGSTVNVSLAGKKYVPVDIDSNGGRIDLSGSRMLYWDADLVGKAGGPSAIGGMVTVSSGRFVEVGASFNSAETNLIVRQSGSLVPAGFIAGGIGAELVDPLGNPLPGIGNFTVSTFRSGGFDSLALNGNVAFEGDVSIKTPGSIRVAGGGVLSSTGEVKLSAGYINAGQAFAAPTLPTQRVILFTRTDGSGLVTPFTFSPTHGTGNLTINAGLIDIGNLSLQGIGHAGFTATRGDIRGNGTLSAAGILEFEAGQIYPTTASRFDVFAYDYTAAGKQLQGSISILAGKSRATPLSAGGTLGIFASKITQAGTLRAPIGKILLGWDGTGTAPADLIVGTNLPRPVTSQLTLASGGVTSVSAEGTIIPYGISPDGNSWIDPAGNDITLGGVPRKTVNLSASNVFTKNGSTVDISGGGDLYAYRWISGNGGTKDILESSGGFAVIPDYGFDYSPYAPFNPDASAINLDGQQGYANSTLKVGDKVTLAGSRELAGGTYTLLPARYALLPGAFLITPQSGTAVNTTKIPEGSRIVAGYRSNGLDQSREGATLITRYEVASSKVIRSRAEYQDFMANTFLKDAAINREFAVPRLPVDSGYLSFSSTASMALQGDVRSAAGKNGRGGLVDISSAADIVINRSGSGGSPGELVLKASQLNEFGVESLLVGGLRNFGAEGVSVTVNTASLTLDNASAALRGDDIILTSKGALSLSKNAKITAEAGDGTFDNLLLGDQTVPGSGDGSLVRVSANSSGGVFRRSVGSSSEPVLVLRSGTTLTGGSIVLDSTDATYLSSAARLNADAVSLASGQISIRLNQPGVLLPTTGLVLSGGAFSSLQNSAKRLSLLSYSSIDVYGTGTVGSRDFDQLSLQAASIRGMNNNGGPVNFTASDLVIGNSAASTVVSPLRGGRSGTITFDANQITLGGNEVLLEGYSDSFLTASDRILVSGVGTFDAAGDLSLVTRGITGISASRYRISAGGLLATNRPAAGESGITAAGFGADLTLEGARVRINGDLALPSGTLTLHARSGSLIIGGDAASNLDLAGTSTTFIDAIRYTSGGVVNLLAAKGTVEIGENALISVSAQNGGGDAGSIRVLAPEGLFDLAGSIIGTAGVNGTKGAFTLDAGSLTNGSLAELDAILNDGSFNRSRDYRIRTGGVRVDGVADSQIYRVAADSGNIVVSGTVNATGATGGTIDFKANGSLIVSSGAVLDASGAHFDAAGKGGSITLEAGNQSKGVIDDTAVLDLRAGSLIDLSIAASESDSELFGRFSGTLHLRAPRNAANTDLHLEAISSSIRGASHVLVEGVKSYALTGIGTITTALQNNIRNDATAYLGASGTTTVGYTAMLDRLTALQPGLDLILAPGAEVYNLNGSITLGTTSSTATSDWNLAGFRFGEKGAAGVLTLRASENLVFHNALSDGFSGGPSLWLSPLMPNNPLLPDNAQSWSLRLGAGSDLSAASFREVRSLGELGADAGFIQLGKNRGSATITGGQNARTSTLIGNSFQVIRTGSGNIDIHAGHSIQLLNPFVSIYTAGTQVADPAQVFAAGDFVVPILTMSPTLPQSGLGAVQQEYAAQYSMAGGNLILNAGGNIERKTRNNSGLIDDSSRQLPNNWLYRRSYVGSDGNYGIVDLGTNTRRFVDPAASTTWWIDCSNFFQSVGTLGGGNVSLTAGNDVSNVDAVAPTNARAAMGRPRTAGLLELGGGDLTVRAGNDISGGVYYVERGTGLLEAGRAITTNSTRSPSFGIVSNLNNPTSLDPNAWVPTLLFAGKAQFDVSARADVLIGPTFNPFLLPTGLNNRFWYKTYFNTFAPDTATSVTSLGGGVTLRNAVTLPTGSSPVPVLRAWMDTQNLLTNSNTSAAWSQPWLRLGETSVNAFSPVLSLAAPTLRLSALSGDLNLVGGLNLFPAAKGQLELVAGRAISALQPTGLSNILISGQSTQVWTASTINVSDANPASVPGSLSPLNYFSVAGDLGSANVSTQDGFLASLASIFTESGSYTGSNASIQVKQARHAAGLLHRDDKDPLRVYALDGDLSGLTLFSPKSSRLFASRDITDVAFYIQNLISGDLSMVSAGRDLIAYNSSSQSRALALSQGNGIARGQTSLAGDVQISGPGTLQVLAGRNLDLGLGGANTDGTGSGITSIGNFRNPFLSSVGADLVIGTGITASPSLGTSAPDFDAFIEKYVRTDEGAKYLTEIAPGTDFDKQSSDEQARLALEVFYQVLRDTGRDFNDPDSPGFGKYTTGQAAVATLFGNVSQWDGEILTQSRDIRTRSGGDISIFAPGGGIAMAESSSSNSLTPPGIITEAGGGISIYTDQDVSIGIGRIFTLRGGDIIIWSSRGNIAAGSSSRTIQSAPPTRVIVDPQSASVETDLAGLATGGGIGVLATVQGVDAGDVDLIAPSGIIDAGDAGIRVSGNINLAAVQVVNAGNIVSGGSSTGAPAPAASAPSVTTTTSASNTAAAATSGTISTNSNSSNKPETDVTADDVISVITVEVIGYGGGSQDEDEDEESEETP
jgi:filamentous hemagglutinin family protein